MSAKYTNSSARSIAESLFGEIRWTDANTGFIRCPGADLHTNPGTKRDCKIHLTGAPTIFCVHNSCAGVIEGKNKVLRSEIGKAQRGQDGNWTPYKPTQADIEREREREQFRRLKFRAEKSLPQIVAAHSCEPVDLWEASPNRLEDDAANDWRLLLRLYRPDDVIWIGEHLDSGKPHHALHFQTAAEWLNGPTPTGTRICPNVFKPRTYARMAKNILEARYLVVESDELSKMETCALFQWLRQIIRLRAVVDTGRRSLHGWFEYPAAEALKELRTILPALKCDKALFGLTQPVRLPGPMRETGRRQHLAYLDLGDAR